MSNDIPGERRFFLTYSGVKLPLKLVTPLAENEVGNRNTYYHGYFNTADQLTGLEKVVYGEVELHHRYHYHPNGQLQRAEITDANDELTVLEFDEAGAPA